MEQRGDLSGRGIGLVWFLEENLSSQKTFDCASTLISFEFRMEALARLRKHPDDDLPVSLAGWPATNRRIKRSRESRIGGGMR
jgi:hypothetical protein